MKRTILPVVLLSVSANAESLLSQIGWEGAPLQVILGILVLVGAAVIVLSLIYVRKRFAQREDTLEVAERLFDQACDRIGLTASEKSKVRQLLRHENTLQPQVILQSVSVFEKCVEAEVEQLLAQHAPGELQREEDALLSSIRRKVGFLHLPLEHPLVSTRNIALGQAGSVFGTNHRIPIIQRAVVVERNEFTFVLQYDADKEDVFQITPGSALKFAFARQNDGLYGVQVRVAKADAGIIEVRHTVDVRRNQLRQFLRIEVNLPLKLRLLKTDDRDKSEIRRGEILEGKIADISGGGLSFLSERSLRAGDIVSVGFSLPSGTFTGLPCKILRIGLQEGKTKTFFRHHAQFVGLEPRKRDAIVKYVFDKQRQLNQWR